MADKFQVFDTDAHLRAHPFPAWVQGSFMSGFGRGQGWAGDKEDLREILELVAEAVVAWLQTLPMGAEIGSGALAKAMAPCPDDVDDEARWYHVLCNRIGTLRFRGLLDGYWHDVPNKRRPKKPHKKYFNGIPA